MFGHWGFDPPPTTINETIINETIVNGGGSEALSAVTFGELPLPSRLLPKWMRAVNYVNIPVGVAVNFLLPNMTGTGYQFDGQAQLLTLGDSTFHVKSAVNSIGLVDHIRRNLSTQMPVAEGIVWCCNNAEPRFTKGAYSLVTGGGWGNSYLEATSPGGDFTFTPDYEFNTVNIYWGKTNDAGYGTVNINIDGGSTLTTLDGHDSAYAWQKTTFTVTKGTHTLHISAPPSGKKFALFGVECFDATRSAMRVIMGGVDGTNSAQFVGLAPAGWESLHAFDLIKPNLTIIMLAKNNPVGYDAIQTSLQPIVTKAKLYGDAVLATPYPSLGVDVALQRAVADGVINLGVTNACGVIDLFNAYSNGTGQTELENGFYGDSVHFCDVGACDVAKRMTVAISTTTRMAT